MNKNYMEVIENHFNDVMSFTEHPINELIKDFGQYHITYDNDLNRDFKKMVDFLEDYYSVFLTET